MRFSLRAASSAFKTCSTDFSEQLPIDRSRRSESGAQFALFRKQRDVHAGGGVWSAVFRVPRSYAKITTEIFRGDALDQAKSVLQKHRIEKLLAVDEDKHIKRLITVKDIQKAINTFSRSKI